ncbi:plasmid replication initiation protein [Pediococcus acidilactici]|uniref:plasmid replication initiation protein n=1 Tax=Pediococcus acidilactici TaxID=1254 RepID=UPI0013259909|nr:plasmid replication initiation protein [Pediococcus acidilactici]KAF0336334.1 plasmid replication initiation protein [Pediococcus acidilactici]KAF0348098.1 plasmid replication initiation protein [Pediococcus acidilactici]KAF0461728.1 plasmid replication initiation protein [Pediococcus acidilactici]KAF0502379.1 plasmid replication initiation protein [Pediococcus acidilactici]KAF0511781.1 plasmid replication initiation protein [Pediococcus acidilactici]
MFFIFTNLELKELLNCSEHKVISIKKQLEEFGLLRQESVGFDPKQKKNLPNRLYLGQLHLTATDVYKMPDFSNKTAETLDMSGTANSAVRQENAETLGTSGTANSAVNQEEYNNLDTNRYYKETAQLDFSTANFSNAQIEKQNQDLVQHAKEFLTEEDNNPIPFEPETIRLISLWANNNPKIIKKTIGIILNARRDVQDLHKDHHLFFILDHEPELQTKITQTLRRYFNALRSDDKQIKNYENYLYITMKNMFENYGSSKLQREYKLEHSTNQIAKNNLSMDLGTEYLN